MEEDVLLILTDGGKVLGTDVDDENKLYYLVERQGEVTLEEADGKMVHSFIKRRDTVTTTVPMQRTTNSDI